MNQPDPSQNEPNEGGQSEQVRIQHVTARVPQNVSRGVFSTGVIVMTGPTEFIIDFVQSVGQPAQVAARIVMPHATMPQFVQALRTNLDLYVQRYGAPPELPRPVQGARQPSAQEIYDDLKLPDHMLSGAYANGVMIGHTASEFKLDFLTNLFPHSAVSSRVFLSAPQVPRMLESLSKTYQQFQQQVQRQREQQQGGQPPEQQPPDPPSSEDELG